MKRLALKLLVGMWLALCVAISGLWLVEAVHPRSMRCRLWGPWTVAVGDEWRGKISLIIFHDLPAPVIGPQMDPGLKYNSAVLAWYYKQPPDIYRHRWGFDCDDHPNFEFNASRNMLLRGTYTTLRMPDWAACVMWLPLAIPLVGWQKRRRRIRHGLCAVCGYNLLATPERCPECGTVAEKNIRA